MRGSALVLLLVWQAGCVAASPAQGAQMAAKRLLARDLKHLPSPDYERARAFASPASLTFTISPTPKISRSEIWVEGTLANPTAGEVAIIVFPTHSGRPLHAYLAPAPGWSWYGPNDPDRPPELGPAMPPAPPPPIELVVPAKSEVTFEGVVPLLPLRWTGEPEVELEWLFHYWNKPQPTGRMKLKLPAR